MSARGAEASNIPQSAFGPGQVRRVVRSQLAFILGVGLALSGCVEGGAEADVVESDVAAAPDVAFDAETGGIEGLVTDDSLMPIAGALVGLLETKEQAMSDAEGRFTFSKLAPGDYTLQVVKIGFAAASKRITVAAGAATEANLAITAIEVEEVYYLVQNAAGRFGCGAAAKIPSAPPLGTRPAIAVCGATYGTPLSSMDQFRTDFHLQGTNVSRVKSLILESEWQSTQATSGGFTMTWEVLQDWGAGTTYTETVRFIASAQGPSPVKAAANNTTFEEGFDDKWTGGSGLPKYCIENGACSIYARAFPYASTLGDSSPVDASVYADQPFRHWVTEFYGEHATEEYTALTDA